MKYILLIIATVFFLDSFSQELPTDSLLLTKIYGSTDLSGNSYTRDLKDNADNFSSNDEIVYSIVYKQFVEIDNREIILIIIDAPNSFMQGHQFGYRDYYFIRQRDENIEIVSSVISVGEIPIGDESEFSIIEIGKNKKALTSVFQSTGNQHFEKTTDILLLDMGKLSLLLTINSEYDNSIWKIPDSEEDECEAESSEENFELIKNGSDWYKIKVHKTEYGFTKGCTDRFKKSESDKIYSYIDGEYKENK